MRTKTVDSYNHKSSLILLKKYLSLSLLFIAPLLWLALVVFSLRGATIEDGGILMPGQPSILLGINTTIRYIIASIITLTVTDVVEASLRHYKCNSIQLNGLELSNLIKLGIEKSFSATADIALHYWVTAEVVLQEGQHKILNNAIQIDPKCGNTGDLFGESNNCAHRETAGGNGLKYPGYGLVIMPRLNDTIWNGYFKSYTIQANCTPASTLCNLTHDFGSQTSIKCPSSLYNVNGNIQNNSRLIMPLGNGAKLGSVRIPTSAGQLGKLEWLIIGQYSLNPSTKYDNEFVSETHGPQAVITYCTTKITASGWTLLNVGKYTEGFDSNGHPVVVQSVLAEMITGTDRIVYDAIRAPSCSACFKSTKFQQQLLSENQAGIVNRDGHFGLFNGVVSSAEGVENTGTPASTE
ncbi:hypothetical protein C2G38_2136225 [Gigaspora rosea]|uniref:Uncharacterized protein n=1 Tax=Gigaspora rosea TaxID=44941 RepID=A0A397W8S9_9GLOM|nr:hypothetical protein C2G38_2136225 [Gigaspora rosea]